MDRFYPCYHSRKHKPIEKVLIEIRVNIAADWSVAAPSDMRILLPPPPLRLRSTRTIIP